MKASLLTDFSKTDKNSWKKRVEKELKGRAYEDILYKPAESVLMEPYYTEEEMESLVDTEQIQAAQKQSPGWLTVPVLAFESAHEVNSGIRNQLSRGADAVWLSCGDTSLTHLELSKTLHVLRLTDTPVFFDTSVNPAELIQELSQGSGYYLKGGIVYDPLAEWMRTGQHLDEAFDRIAEGMEPTKTMKEFRSYKVESHVFHEAGADVVQELAYTLASFVTYLDQLTDRGISALPAATRCLFSFSVGTDYLAEISKLRAWRYLYRRITRAYGLPDELCHAYVHCQTSRLYQSAHSPHTNLIRRTSEAMSAVIGGCDALSIAPYDAIFEEPTDFSERIARNISLILQNESYLDKVADPAAGSYFIEIQTQKLADAAWELFLEIENQGGLIKAFEKNLIQEKIKNSWNELVNQYHNGKVLVGANKYREKAQVDESPTEAEPEDLSPSWEFALLKPHTLDRIF